MKYTLIALACIHALWLHYVAIMRLKQIRAANGLTLGMKVFGYPALAMGLVLDLIVNVVVLSIILLEIPREWTVSSRLWRLSNAAPSWRQRACLWLRVELLDAADPDGVHKG